MRALLCCGLAVFVWPAAALAQPQPSRIVAPPQKPGGPTSLYSSPSPDNPPDTRFAVTFTLTRPLPSDDPTDVTKTEQAVRHALFALLDKECDVLEGTIASKCELQSLNVNMNMEPGFFPRFGYAAQPEGRTMSASANAVFGVTLRADAR
jgi:hypothetical protein